MADYISRQRILNYIDDEYCMHCEHSDGVRCENCHYEDVRIAIKSMPAADVQPVRRGRWECVGHDDKTYWYRCSACGHEEHDNMTKHDKYCSSCGARMDAEPDEPWQSD